MTLLDDLRVAGAAAADLAVTRIGDRAAAEARDDLGHAGHLTVDPLDAPETSRAERCELRRHGSSFDGTPGGVPMASVCAAAANVSRPASAIEGTPFGPGRTGPQDG